MREGLLKGRMFDCDHTIIPGWAGRGGLVGRGGAGPEGRARFHGRLGAVPGPRERRRAGSPRVLPLPVAGGGLRCAGAYALRGGCSLRERETAGA